jgi:hypothetical protein
MIALTTMLVILSIASAVSELLVMIGLPLLVFARRPRTGQRMMAARFFVSVLLVWVGLVAHRLFIGLPLALRRAEAHGNFGYDGIGGNLTYLIGGWIMGLLGSTVALVILNLARWLLQRRRMAQLAADESVRPRNALQGEMNPYAAGEGNALHGQKRPPRANMSSGLL